MAFMAILRPGLALGTAAVVVVGLLGCSSAPKAPRSPSGDAARPTVESSAVLDGGTPEDPAEETAQPPRWDESSRLAAVGLAEHATAAWINTAVSESSWRTGLKTWFPPSTLEYYADVDPRNIKAGRVRAAGARVTDESSPYLAVVRVPTNAGAYEVTLSRATALEPWQVEQVEAVQE